MSDHGLTSPKSDRDLAGRDRQLAHPDPLPHRGSGGFGSGSVGAVSYSRSEPYQLRAVKADAVPDLHPWARVHPRRLLGMREHPKEKRRRTLALC